MLTKPNGLASPQHRWLDLLLTQGWGAGRGFPRISPVPKSFSYSLTSKNGSGPHRNWGSRGLGEQVPLLAFTKACTSDHNCSVNRAAAGQDAPGDRVAAERTGSWSARPRFKALLSHS